MCLEHWDLLRRSNSCWNMMMGCEGWIDYSPKAPLERTLYTVLNNVAGRATGRRRLGTISTIAGSVSLLFVFETKVFWFSTELITRTIRVALRSFGMDGRVLAMMRSGCWKGEDQTLVVCTSWRISRPPVGISICRLIGASAGDAF